MLTRRRARGDLRDYVMSVPIPNAPRRNDGDHDWLLDPPGTHLAAHHNLILTEMATCMGTPGGRLMLMLPPGSAKSTYASITAPTWWMANSWGDPRRVILSSYSAAPAVRHSRAARALVRSERFRQIMQCGLDKGSQSEDEWGMSNGAQFSALGILGSVTSRRADGLIIDDPVAGQLEAESELNRDRIFDAYQYDLSTRLTPDGWRVLIMTRWHQDDLMGRILPADWAGESGDIMCRDGHIWRVLCLPARATRADDPLNRAPGEYLWEEYAGNLYRDVEKNPLNKRVWTALYQQNPVPEKGGMFDADHVQWYEPGEKLPDMKIYGSSDWAVSEGTGDFTEHGVWGLGTDGYLYALDWFSGQVGTSDGIAQFIALCKRYKPLAWIGERGVIEKAIGPAIDRAMRDAQVFVGRMLLPTVGNKQARAMSFASRWSARGVRLPAGKQWAKDMVAQLVQFPYATHDDKVDVCGLIGRGLDSENAPSIDEKPDVAPALASLIDTLIGNSIKSENETARIFEDYLL